MTRKDRIRLILEEFTGAAGEDGFQGKDAFEIAEAVGLDRGNVSRELNELVEDGVAVKTRTRPVRFADKNRLQQEITLDLTPIRVVESIEGLLRQYAGKKEEDPFSTVIGAKASLEIPIRKAKAAILYPARGMHTLLAGPTGVGKSMFAEKMYQYGKKMHVLDQKAAFIIFNCAEYADNPQLLISQLFGHTKGAFTGADREKTGLVERANHGILFLDEIHRLTPEGQEMLFLLMDRGIYRKLGETDSAHKADVTIIGATTENLEQSLLKTFIRRMPVVIELPALKERSEPERLQLVEGIFNSQAAEIRTGIRVHRNVIAALLLYECRGNIGQLVADIQMICAEGFLEYKVKGTDEVRIEVPALPDYIYKGLLNCRRGGSAFLDYICAGDEYYYFQNQQNVIPLLGRETESAGDMYAQITEKYNEYRKKGVESVRINEILYNDIQGYFRDLLIRYQAAGRAEGKETLLKLVSPRIYQAVEDAVLLAERKLKRSISSDMKAAFAMHVSALCERIENHHMIENEQINQMAYGYPEELKAAKMIRRILEEELNLVIPDQEIGFIAMFLCAVQTNSRKRIGVVVAAHGDSTAGSMARVVNTILNTDHCRWVDMKLEDSVESALEETIDQVRQADEGNGVILLTDMGSLSAFHEIICQKTGIDVMGLDMVSTPLLLEAVRKSMMPGVTLRELWNDLCRSNPYMGLQMGEQARLRAHTGKRRTVITTCVSGRGAAKKIADLIKGNLPPSLELKVDLQPLDITARENALQVLRERRIENVAAVVGTIDLQLPGVPYISLEQFITKNGIRRLQLILDDRQEEPGEAENTDGSLFAESLGQILEFLDPVKTYECVARSFQRLQNFGDFGMTRDHFLRYLFHVSCMIERLIKKEVLPYKGIEVLEKERPSEFERIREALGEIGTIFELEIPDSEVGYIFDLVQDDAL